jgi:plastocyanin
MRAALATLAVLALALPTAAAKDLSMTLHVGTNADGTMYIEPKEPSVAVGDRVTLTVVNDDAQGGTVQTQHDIVIKGIAGPRAGGACPAVTGAEEEGQNVEFEVCTQAQATQTFTASEAGRWSMECEVAGHAAKGMKGRFVVAAQAGKSAPGLEPLLGIAALAALALALRRGA